MFFHICDSHGCYLNLTTFVTALLTTIVVVLVLKGLGHTTLENWGATSNEGEGEMMQGNVRPSNLFPYTFPAIDPSLQQPDWRVIPNEGGEGMTQAKEEPNLVPSSTFDPSLTGPSLGRGSIMGKQTWGNDDGDLPLSYGWHMQAGNHLEQPSMLLYSSSSDSLSKTCSKFSPKEDLDTNSVVLSTFTFDSRPTTPPFPHSEECTEQKNMPKRERKQRKASPSKMPKTLPPAKRHKKQDQRPLSPQLSPRSVSTQIFRRPELSPQSVSTKIFYRHKKVLGPLPTPTQYHRQTPRSPLRTMATTRPTFPPFTSQTMKHGRKYIFKPKPPVPSQPLSSSLPITLANSMFLPYPLHKPCPLSSHELPFLLPPFDQQNSIGPKSKCLDIVQTLSRHSTKKIQNREGHHDKASSTIFNDSQNQEGSFGLVKCKLGQDNNNPLNEQLNSDKKFSSIHHEQQEPNPQDDFTTQSVIKSVEHSDNQKAKFKSVNGEVPTSNIEENMTSQLASSSTTTIQDSCTNAQKYDYALDLDSSMSSSHNAPIMDGDSNANYNATTITLRNVESVVTTSEVIPEDNNIVEMAMNMTVGENIQHGTANQALNIHVQESDCKCGSSPPMRKNVFKVNYKIQQKHQCQDNVVGHEQTKTKCQVVNSTTKPCPTNGDLITKEVSNIVTPPLSTSFCNEIPYSSIEPPIELPHENFCRENVNNRDRTCRSNSTSQFKGCDQLQEKEEFQAPPSLQLLQCTPLSLDRRPRAKGALRSSFYFAHCEVCEAHPRYKNI